MAKTTISDLAIVPVTFQEYMEKLIMEKSQLFQAGLVQNVPTFIPSKGKVTNSPAFLGFTGDDEVLSDSGSLTVNKVDSVNSVAVINFRGKAFGNNDLVTALAGADPLGGLANKYADYWVRMLNRATLNTIRGAVGGMEVDFAGLIINDQKDSVITTDMALDTKQLMGEYSDELDLVIMHSAVHTKLQKLDKLVVGAFGSAATPIDTYMGARVIIDDTMSAIADSSPLDTYYDTYFARSGAVGYSEGQDPAKSIEVDRDILAGDDIVTSRKRYIMHVGGSTWDGTPGGNSPTNAELATAGNWSAEDTSEAKRFGIRVLRHKI